MKVAKAFFLACLIGVLASPVWAEEKISLVIGKNLKVGMPLNEVIALLGIPNTLNVQRGTEPLTDSVAIRYEKHGVVVHALNKKTTVEEIEVLPSFKGTFEAGVKIGAKFNDLIEKYGMPETLNAQVARYPQQGLYFLLEREVLVSAKVFTRDSKILDHKLINP